MKQSKYSERQIAFTLPQDNYLTLENNAEREIYVNSETYTNCTGEKQVLNRAGAFVDRRCMPRQQYSPGGGPRAESRRQPQDTVTTPSRHR